MTGISIILYEKTKTGVDAFNAPVYSEVPTTVDNVLVGEPSTEEIVDELRISGKRLAYTLGIPKGDTHIWQDSKVSIRGELFETIGYPTQGIDHLVPTKWNKKVKVVKYGG